MSMPGDTTVKHAEVYGTGNAPRLATPRMGTQEAHELLDMVRNFNDQDDDSLRASLDNRDGQGRRIIIEQMQNFRRELRDLIDNSVRIENTVRIVSRGNADYLEEVSAG